MKDITNNKQKIKKKLRKLETREEENFAERKRQ